MSSDYQAPFCGHVFDNMVCTMSPDHLGGHFSTERVPGWVARALAAAEARGRAAGLATAKDMCMEMERLSIETAHGYPEGHPSRERWIDKSITAAGLAAAIRALASPGPGSTNGGGT